MIKPIGEEPKANNIDSEHKGMDSDDDIWLIIHTMHVLVGYSNL